ncbi:ABC transporter ATP-binding protein [Culicoidibacter larvae]|uniref:ABC transporter ATP-binding protein n=1 Tax=Culicoidibacter larvae TaxID=2579976 RepID=A0A5R8QCG2_9FIRM|nr:ABC transporter ATP-binding protein [Culicoidibacter larvae]TLG74192.1 ABC transporter ATP-binding protein [Culicoidibacter larvae]
MKMKTVSKLLRFAAPYRLLLVLVVVMAVIQVGATLLAPILIGQAIDHIIGVNNVQFDQILIIALQLVVVILVAVVAQLLLARSTNKLAYNMVHDLRRDATLTIGKMPLRAIDERAHGEIISRVITDIDIISDGLLQGFSQLFTGILTIFGTLLFMFLINVWVTLIVLILTPVSLFVATIIAKKSYTRFNEQSRLRGEMTGYIEEMINNQNVVQTFSYESRSQENFEEINERLYQSGVRAQFYSSLTNPSTRFINALVYVVVGIAGALLVLGGSFSIGALSAFLTYANQYMKPFNEITGVITELQSALASATRVLEIIDAPSEVADSKDAFVLEAVTGAVELDNVAFSYTNKPFITDFSLQVEPGEIIAIVGPTGCGKTTLINLLMRFFEIDDGIISVDGKNIKMLTKDSLRTQYGMVLQESWLFHGTIRENIAYGKPDASENEIIAASKLANAHFFIEQLPDGYDTYITDGNGSISEGQRQLLCIARIFLIDPPMLILDEATSSIDTRTEIQIQRAMDAMMQGRTSFIIAHRLSTIKNAHRIVVMKDGKIIEVGNHQQLLDLNGFYANLYNTQFE